MKNELSNRLQPSIMNARENELKIEKNSCDANSTTMSRAGRSSYGGPIHKLRKSLFEASAPELPQTSLNGPVPADLRTLIDSTVSK